MIGHLFKLVWNRRRSNALILLELLISFLGLAWVLTMGCLFLRYWYTPLGFEYDRVWKLDTGVRHFLDLDEQEKVEEWATMDQLRLLLTGMDEIESFSPLAWNVPFSSAASGYHTHLRGRQWFIRDNRVWPAALETLGLKLLAGRWLEEGDAALNWNPVVLTRDYAELLFGDEDPIGREVFGYDENGETSADEDDPVSRVVGVIDAVRRDGEFNDSPPAQFSLVEWGAPAFPPAQFILKVRTGVPAVFEEKLIRAIGDVAPLWKPRITPLSVGHDRIVRDAVLPLLIFAAVAFFLIVMVGLGLVGVLWQAVTRRTEELGLRRALGASSAAIRRQVLGELLALTSVAAGIGTLLYAHFPLLQVFPPRGMTFATYAQGLGLTLLVIYSFVLVCGLYPSWLATRVQPAQALQHE
jgi:putative ABC transport system permease protein